MKKFTLTSNDANQSLFKFLSKILYNASDSLIYKSIRKGRIRIDGKKCADKDVKLIAGQALEVYINDEYFGSIDNPMLKSKGAVDVVYEDDNILICDKPQGQLTHPDKKENVNTLITNAQKYLCDRGEYTPESENSFAPSLCHRIDRNTRGLVIIAKNFESLKIISDAFKEHKILKKYLALVEKPIDQGVYTAYLQKEKGNQVKIYTESSPYSREIITEVLSCEKCDSGYITEIVLHTGRTHQIRAHLAYLGSPIVGDNKYGDYKRNKSRHTYRQMLCSYCLTFGELGGGLSYLTNKKIQLEKKKTDEFFKN